MTIKERIDKFMEKYPKPEQWSITLDWYRKDGYHSYTYQPYGEETKYHYNVGRRILFQHYRVDEELGLAELAYVEFDSHTPKDKDTPWSREWEYLERYFLPKEEKRLFDRHGVEYNRYICRKITWSWSTSSPKEFLHNFSNLSRMEGQWNKFLDFFKGNTKMGNSRWHNELERPWGLSIWFTYKDTKKVADKTQKSIEQCLATTHANDKLVIQAIIAHKDKHDGEKNCRYNYDREESWAFIDAGAMCIRCYDLSLSPKNVLKSIKESKRCYITPKKVLILFQNQQKQWLPLGSFTENMLSYRIINPDKLTILPYGQWIYDYYYANSERERLFTSAYARNPDPNVYTVLDMFKRRDIEQLWKMGYHEIVTHLVCHGTTTSSLKTMFGEPLKGKGKNASVLQRYGLTAKQLKVINNDFVAQREEATRAHNSGCYYHVRTDTFATMRGLLGNDMVNVLDLNTFKDYFGLIRMMSYRTHELLRKYSEKPEESKILFDKLVRYVNAHGKDAITVYFDTESAYERISPMNRPRLHPRNIQKYEDLIRAHDQYNAIYNQEQEERRRIYNAEQAECQRLLEENRKKMDKERIKWNYEDDKYVIRLPQTLSEIQREGCDLGHCVGGYTDRHAQGYTTIMFLRKKELPNTSFYTIEVNQDHRVVQIHGKRNKWLGNDPDAIPSVMRWLRQNGFNCTDQILLSTAQGYCAGNAKWVEKPGI